jgi:hypothetical protein
MATALLGGLLCRELSAVCSSASRRTNGNPQPTWCIAGNNLLPQLAFMRWETFRATVIAAYLRNSHAITASAP